MASAPGSLPLPIRTVLGLSVPDTSGIPVPDVSGMVGAGVLISGPSLHNVKAQVDSGTRASRPGTRSRKRASRLLLGAATLGPFPRSAATVLPGTEMDGSLPGEVTRLLRASHEGDVDAVPRLIPLVYGHLRELAEAQLRRESPGHTLTPTALVHEAYLKLQPGLSAPPRDRAHFLAIAARAMRQVLVDHARTRRARKRGGGWARATLTDEIPGAAQVDPEELLALDRAMESLDPRQRQVVECWPWIGPWRAWTPDSARWWSVGSSAEWKRPRSHWPSGYRSARCVASG